MPAPRADLADPAVLATLGDLEVVARWVVDGFLTGLHRSPRRGSSVSFAEHRPYQPGDDPRYLDWRIAARADRLVVKQFEEETNLRAMVVLDVSGSMQWAGAPARLTKRAYAERLVAALALLLLRQHDAVGLVRVDAAARDVVPPRARSDQWRRLLAVLSDPGGGGVSDLGPGLDHALRLVRRPGLVVVVSDLLVDPAPVVDRIALLRAAGHDVALLHVLDPAERDLALAGDGRFEDPETGAGVFASAADVAPAYRAALAAALAGWRRDCQRLGARYTIVDTAAPFADALRPAFDARAAALRVALGGVGVGMRDAAAGAR